MVQLASSPAVRRSSALALKPGLTKPVTSSSPKLVVLEKPQTVKSVVPFTIVCTLTILGVLIASLLLNISMTNTSYQITNLQVELQQLNDQVGALEEELELLGTPQELQRKAIEMGMQPITSIQYIDLSTKSIVASANLSEREVGQSVAFVPSSDALKSSHQHYGMGNERE